MGPENTGLKNMLHDRLEFLGVFGRGSGLREKDVVEWGVEEVA